MLSPLGSNRFFKVFPNAKSVLDYQKSLEKKFRTAQPLLVLSFLTSECGRCKEYSGSLSDLESKWGGVPPHAKYHSIVPVFFGVAALPLRAENWSNLFVFDSVPRVIVVDLQFDSAPRTIRELSHCSPALWYLRSQLLSQIPKANKNSGSIVDLGFSEILNVVKKKVYYLNQTKKRKPQRKINKEGKEEELENAKTSDKEKGFSSVRTFQAKMPAIVEFEKQVLAIRTDTPTAFPHLLKAYDSLAVFHPALVSSIFLSESKTLNYRVFEKESGKEKLVSELKKPINEDPFFSAWQSHYSSLLGTRQTQTIFSYNIQAVNQKTTSDSNFNSFEIEKAQQPDVEVQKEDEMEGELLLSTYNYRTPYIQAFYDFVNDSIETAKKDKTSKLNLDSIRKKYLDLFEKSLFLILHL